METATRGDVRGGTARGAAAPARDIAIVGMDCVVPGAPDAEAFWANVVDGVDSVTEVSRSRWDPDRYYHPEGRGPDGEPMSVSKWGGWIPDVGFDALAWGIPPASLASIDPAQLLALKVAAAALDDAGYGAADRPFDRDRTSLVYATGSGGAIELTAGIALRTLLRSHGVDHLPAELDAHLPQITPDGLPGVLTSVIAGRVANRLDLGGKNLTVDSACASVLVGLDVACGELAGGSSDMVLCGGVDLHNSAQDYLSFTAAGALSPRGRCHAFDADADGMTLAEGAGCLILKRLADAEQDGDRIYAVIRGVAGSSDGRHLGLTAPRREGQVKAVQRAYDASGISPREVGLVEAHGTGTATGDRTELETMTGIFGEAGATPGSVVLGASKSNIGHIKCASGIASLIKAAKAAYHGVLPPTLHVTRPNEAWDPETSPFAFRDRARPWLEDRRVVGVSAFGFGGTNFHAILENHRRVEPAPAAVGAAGTPDAPDLPRSGRPCWPAELVTFRAPTGDDLHARLLTLNERLAGELTPPRQADRWRLRDIAAAESRAGEGPVRLALVATSLDDLATKLQAARAGRTAPGVHRPDPALAGGTDSGTGTTEPPDPGGGDPAGPAVALLHPGPAAATPGMGADLLTAFPEPRRPAGEDGRVPIDVLWPPQAFGDRRQQQHDALTEVAAPATALIGGAVAGLLADLGVTPVARVVAGDDPRTGLPAEGDADRGDDELADDIRALADRGVRIFVETGPGHGLTDLATRALADRPHLAVSVDAPGEHGLAGLLDALAALAVAGVPVDIDGLHAGRDVQPDRWLDPGRPPAWIVNGHCARTAEGEPLERGVRPADLAPQVRVTGADDPVPGPATGTPAGTAAAHPGQEAAGATNDATQRDMAVVLEYLRLVQGIVATGSEVIRSQAEAASDPPPGTGGPAPGEAPPAPVAGDGRSARANGHDGEVGATTGREQR